jgi:staphylococcal nuclease domain-containing protein 1
LQLEDGTSWPEAGLEAGWLKVREEAGRKDDKPETAELIDSFKSKEAKAQSENKGIWDKSASQIELRGDIGDPQAFLEKWKGKQLDGIVERVISGDRLAVRLLTSPKSHVETIVLLAGIKAPTTKRTVNSVEQPAEEGGEEAKEFVTSRLLNRNVHVEIVGLSPNNQLVATIKHPARGNIAPFILSSGLARCIDFHSTMLGSEMATLRKAEQQAKHAQVGIFKGLAARKAGSGVSEGTVTRIQSADTIFVRTRTGEERKLTLSSIRGPKASDPKQSAFAAEAREFVRKTLIGKHVKFSVDGKTPARDGFEERETATVILKDNVALAIVKAGYASVIRHRRDDEDRSPIYDELLAAEETAQKEKKGFHSDKQPTSATLVDASENAQMAKRYFSILERKSSIPGVVDYVKAGARFTVHIPSEGAKLTLVLAGIKAPRSARNPSEQGEAFGQEAHDFANRHCNQRDCRISVEGIDKVGGFIGSLTVGNDDFARLLVEAGLASVQPFWADKNKTSGKATKILEAEKNAQDAKKGIWHDYVEESPQNGHYEESPAATAEASANRKRDYREAVVSHIEDTGTLKLQLVGSGTDELVNLSKSLQSFHLSPSNSAGLTGPPKVGDIVSAKFSLDDQWYRAKVRHVDRGEKKADVLYLDYGNSEKLSWAKLRPLPAAQFGVQKLKAQAVEAVLAGVELPKQADYLQDAVSFLQSAVQDKTLVASVEFTDKEGHLHIVLFDPAVSTKSDESINADLLAEGLGLAAKGVKGELGASLIKTQDKAISNRSGMWEYGDLRED